MPQYSDTQDRVVSIEQEAALQNLGAACGSHLGQAISRGWLRPIYPARSGSLLILRPHLEALETTLHAQVVRLTGLDWSRWPLES